MPSFDVVSEVDEAEVINALDQARKEIATRFDFKDAGAEIVHEKNEIKLRAVDGFKLKALEEVVLGKLARRNVSLKNIERKPAEVSSTGKASQTLAVKQGMEGDIAKQVTAAVKATKLKVQAQIQGQEVRVTGKNRDDLQAVIAALRAQEFPVALGFKNFRA
ncbi:MAG: YajQ family cyclic di-GMP-binding protein [Verrucomicrobium sp.]|nr:YajQ family cyclic di-GMP-binding protein [Verrucomicrobium sp.]